MELFQTYRPLWNLAFWLLSPSLFWHICNEVFLLMYFILFFGPYDMNNCTLIKTWDLCTYTKYTRKMIPFDDVIMIYNQIDSITRHILRITIRDENKCLWLTRKHYGSASLAFVWGIHRGPVNSPHKWPVTRNMFPFDDVIMNKK